MPTYSNRFILTKYPGPARHLARSLDDRKLPVLGEAYAVRDVLQAAFPGLEWEEDDQALWINDSIEIGFLLNSKSEGKPVDWIQASIYGHEDGVTRISALCKRHGWRVYSESEERFLDIPLQPIRKRRAFDQDRYLREMQGLVDDAREKITMEAPSLEVYTVSVWTDPDAAFSAVSIDSYDHYQAQIERFSSARRAINEDLAKRMANSQSRITSPADFEYPEVLKIRNKSFPLNWNTDTHGQSWELLSPLLLQAAEYARQAFSVQKLHPDAEVGVNGRNSWYEKALRF